MIFNHILPILFRRSFGAFTSPIPNTMICATLRLAPAIVVEMDAEPSIGSCVYLEPSVAPETSIGCCE